MAVYAGQKRHGSDESVSDVVLPWPVAAESIYLEQSAQVGFACRLGVDDLSVHVAEHLQEAAGKPSVHGLFCKNRKVFSIAEKQMAGQKDPCL